MKNPLLTKQYKCFRGNKFEYIGFIVTAKNEEQARLYIIEELESIGVSKPFEVAEEFVICEILKDPLK